MHKGMTLAEMARDIHENAKAHGWWDEERETAEVYALIHSEWSEALEEYRAGRPDRWYECDSNVWPDVCDEQSKKDCPYHKPEGKCVFQGAKPEGVCVELIDGVIRILDYIAYRGEADEYSGGSADWYFEMLDAEGEEWTNKVRAMSVPVLVNRLHIETCGAWRSLQMNNGFETDGLLETATVAWQWIKGRVLDPEELLIEKHEYNVTRPYKHGKVC